MIENILFCVGIGLQIFAWFLAGGELSFRPRGQGRKLGKLLPAKYNNRSFRRFLLLAGAGIVTAYAFFIHDYVLLGGQCILFCILWARISLRQE